MSYNAFDKGKYLYKTPITKSQQWATCNYAISLKHIYAILNKSLNLDFDYFKEKINRVKELS